MRIILSGKKIASKCKKLMLRGKIQKHEMGAERIFALSQPQLQARAAAGQTVSQHAIMDLPMNLRNPSSFFTKQSLSSDCWVDFLVCPRRFLAILPSHARANLFAGD
jgi:hypothetical protein